MVTTTKYMKKQPSKLKKRVQRFAEGGVVDDPPKKDRDKYGEFLPFEGSIPTFPPGSSKPRYVLPDGTLRPEKK